MEQGENLPQICRKTDNGSGVAIGECFAIYTAAARSNNNIDQQELSIKAEQVNNSIEIIRTEDDLKGRKIRSFNVETVGTLLEFLRNARRAKKHCIVGLGSQVDCLLALLKRPWCLLEVCCLPDSLAIQALAEFAAVAERIPGQRLVFEGATTLLSYELRARNRTLPGTLERDVVSRGSLGLGNFEVLTKLSISLFHQSEKSYRRDILRIIYVYAVYSEASIRNVISVQLVDTAESTSSKSIGGTSTCPTSNPQMLNTDSRHQRFDRTSKKEPLDNMKGIFGVAVQQMCETFR